MADDSASARSPGGEKPRRKRTSKDDGRRGDQLSGPQLIAEARRQLAEITGMEAGAVTAMERSDEDGWKLSVELVELSRVPRAADVLGMYEVTLDAAGQVQAYRRVRRYARGETRGLDDG